jgi:hypothetical protein
MTYDINYYKAQFEKLGKSDVFEINLPFIEELVAVKNRIESIHRLSGDTFIEVHPSNPKITRVPEHEKWLLQLERTYKDMIVTLNRIIGDLTGEEKDALEEWLRERRQSTTEQD